MARWKLTEPHYLQVPGTKWELTLNDQATGRPRKHSFNVPLYVHPDTPSDWNYQPNRGEDGEIHVCHEGRGEKHDLVFVGDPTPGMLPLDDEARELSAKFAWKPTQGTDDVSQSESFSQKLLLGLMDQMQSQTQAAPMAPGFDKFMDTMLGMMQQQQQILAALTAKATEPAPPVIIDNEPPLEDLEPTAEEIAAQAAAEAKAKPQTHMRGRR